VNIKSKKIFFFFLIFCFFLIKADFVLALEQQYPPIFSLSIGSGTLPEYARYFFNIGMAMAGILAAIVIAFGGIYYLVSLGMGKFTDEGKQWIKAGVLGLLLIVSSYLIAYTINPNLVVFNLNGLLPIPFGNFFQPPPTNTTPFVYYNEIPIGTLTENTLSRTMDCYDYDENGDPIEGKVKTDDNRVINGPPLLNHDRADCSLKLTEAAEKKSKLIKKLSDKIVTLMNQCSCAGKCDNTCNADSLDACKPPVGKECLTGLCIGAACKPFEGKSNDCCPEGVKDKIEHGPIKVSNCVTDSAYPPRSQCYSLSNNENEYKGLDEFRAKRTNISGFVEIQPKPEVSGKKVTIINNGNCQLCDDACSRCNPENRTCLSQCEINNTSCQENRRTCLQKNSKWGSLRLIEQLMYFNEKMDQIKSSAEKDLGQLKSAENILGQCYLAEPYVDLLKTNEKTKKEDKIILVQKTFGDPETQKQIDVYKYCKGFDYANSNAYSKCQNICPETLEDKTCYQRCQRCNEENPQRQTQCLKNQTQCVKACYDKHKCPNYANNNQSNNPPANPPFTPATFDKCIEGLNQQCSDACVKKYSCSSQLCPQKDLQECQKKCGNDLSSKCLLKNEEICTVNFPQLKVCSDNYSDPDDLKNCIDNSFLCKYGSDEYAGYPDCRKTQGQYSSSFLYQNPNDQKCKNPYEPYISNTNTTQTCLYPETAKCPVNSKCPKCPCGIIAETINYDSGGISGGGGGGGGGGQCPPGFCLGPMCAPGDCKNDSVCQPGYCFGFGCVLGDCGGGGSSSGGSSSGSGTEKILEYQIVAGTCSEFAYNDDPLTFYCQQNWWQKENKTEEKLPTPIGKEKVCSKENEIPVGQTIDDTEKWANEFTKNINDFIKTIREMIQYMKSIGQEEKYCQCDSTCEKGLPCSSGCQYVPEVCVDDIDVDGNPIVTCTPASCAVQPCDGISCQKVINLLKGGSTKNCPVEKNGTSYYYNKIYKVSKEFYKFSLVDGRTDILKELSYSRKKMNEVSTDQSAFGNEVKVLSCERVKDNIISPIIEGKIRIDDKTIKSYCYGKVLGKILNTPEPMADNWFYCEKRQGINK